MTATDDWPAEWKTFLRNIEGLVNRTDPDRTGIPVETGREPPGVAEITRMIVDDLTTEEALAALTEALDGVEPRVGNRLYDEIRLFNASIDPNSGVGGLHEQDLTARLSKSTTVKDSAKSILPLPDWMDRSLEILDELIDLVT